MYGVLVCTMYIVHIDMYYVHSTMYLYKVYEYDVRRVHVHVQVQVLVLCTHALYKVLVHSSTTVALHLLVLLQYSYQVELIYIVQGTIHSSPTMYSTSTLANKGHYGVLRTYTGGVESSTKYI